MRSQGNSTLIHRLFSLGMIGKAVDGVFEVIGGISLFLVRPDQISGLFGALTQHELNEDPHDLVAGWILQSVQHLSTGTEVFAAFFLLCHGVVKIALVVALWKRQLWAYPAAMVIFGLFLLYQGYRFAHTHSVWMLTLSVLDVLVIVLTWLEYQRLHRGYGVASLRR